MRAHLAEAAARALRPHAGEWLPASTEALIFDDRSHLLACLASEWLAGRTHTWWWACLVPGKDFSALVALWRDAPQSVPAALVRLDTLGQAAAFADAMPDAAVHTLLAEVAVTFGLRALVDALRSVQAGDGRFLPSIHPLDAATVTDNNTLADKPMSSAADPDRTPLDALPGSASPQTVGPFADAAPDVRAMLIEVARAIQSEPARVHSQEFVRGLFHAARTAPVSASQPDSARPAARSSTGRASRVDATFHRDDAATDAPPRPQAEASAQPWPEISSPTTRTPVPPEEEKTDTTTHAAPPAKAMAATADAVVLHTPYGGLFFLLNLFVYRGLYADFDAPLTPGLPVDPFDMLALAGLALWGDPFRDDALWRLLAELAARAPASAPGADVSPEALGGLALDKWFANLWAELRADLLRTLDVDRADDDGLAALFRRAAQIHVTPTRLDVVFALDDLEIAFRRSRLDRDPGWIPAARRQIRFHFE